MAKGFKKAADTIGGSSEPRNTAAMPEEVSVPEAPAYTPPAAEPTPAAPTYTPPAAEPTPAAPMYTPPAAEPTPAAPTYTPPASEAPAYTSPVAAPAPTVAKRSRKGLVIAVIIALIAAILAVGAALYVFNIGGLKDTVNKFIGISSEPAVTQSIDSENEASEPEEQYSNDSEKTERENNTTGTENIDSIII